MNFLLLIELEVIVEKLKTFCDLRKNSNINEIAYYKIRKNKNTDINNFLYITIIRDFLNIYQKDEYHKE